MKFLNFLVLLSLVVAFSGCMGMKSDYKPLYQAKPKIETLGNI